MIVTILNGLLSEVSWCDSDKTNNNEKANGKRSITYCLRVKHHHELAS